MGTKKEVVRSGHGVLLTRIELVNDGAVVNRAYLLETLRTPEKQNFASLAEADAAYIEELAASQASDLVAQRLQRR